jgi:hypothetical protein
MKRKSKNWGAKWRPSDGGYSFRARTRRHAGKDNEADLFDQALPRAMSMGRPPMRLWREVEPRIRRSSLLPTLNGGTFGTDEQLEAVLEIASKKAARTYSFERTDRPVRKDGAKPIKTHTPVNANESFHENSPPHIVLAERKARQMGLPDSRHVFEANQRYRAKLVEEQTGVKVLAVCDHAPNPFLDDALEEAGWIINREPVSENEEQKFGGWNHHGQFYITRVWEGKYVCKHRDFRFAQDVLLSQLWLKAYGVDIHACSRSSKAEETRQEYLAGKPLPEGLAAKVIARKLSKAKAIELAVVTTMKAWDRSWEACKHKNKRLRAAGKKALHAENMAEKVEHELADRREVQEPIDWVLSFEGTGHLEQSLIALDPRYEAILKDSREIYRTIKTRHYECGFAITLNELLGDFEREEAVRRRKEPQELESAAGPIADKKSADYQTELETVKAKLRETEARADEGGRVVGLFIGGRLAKMEAALRAIISGGHVTKEHLQFVETVSEGSGYRLFPRYRQALALTRGVNAQKAAELIDLADIIEAPLEIATDDGPKVSKASTLVASTDNEIVQRRDWEEAVRAIHRIMEGAGTDDDRKYLTAACIEQASCVSAHNPEADEFLSLVREFSKSNGVVEHASPTHFENAKTI